MTNNLYKDTQSDDYFLSYYNPIDIPNDYTDYYITIKSKYQYKPKLLAFDLYGDSSLSWVFTYFNRSIIENPIFDLKSGLKIKVPTKERLYKYL